MISNVYGCVLRPENSNANRFQFAIGNSDFKSVVGEDGVIIDDKTQVKLIVRPRSFGKTFNMSMLNYFFDIENKALGYELFHQKKFGKKMIIIKISKENILLTKFL